VIEHATGLACPYNRLLECQLTFSAIQSSAAWLSENLYAFLRPRTVLIQVVGQRIALANRADDCWLGQIGRHVSVASLLFAITFLREATPSVLSQEHLLAIYCLKNSTSSMAIQLLPSELAQKPTRADPLSQRIFGIVICVHVLLVGIATSKSGPP
jgi:hypothetical protein